MAKQRKARGIEFGSEAHAGLLGLRKAKADDKIQHDGWAFVDLTQFGFNFRDEVVMDFLRQRVNELTMPPQIPQDKDPTKPNYLQPMWTPQESEQALREREG